MTHEIGTLMEPLNCTYGAFIKASPKPGESVLIVGSGPAGLLFLQSARAFGCAPLLMSGGGALRLELARQLGATETWDYKLPDLGDRIQGATDSEGPHIAIEASGTDAGVRQAFESVRPGGRVVLYGITGTSNHNIPSDLIVSKGLTVVTGIGSALLWDEIIALAASGQMNLAPIITHRFSLDEHERALSVASDVEQSAKVVFCP
jgi:threonine dehydrogenase-like Zn-dependent dehydrogenase